MIFNIAKRPEPYKGKERNAKREGKEKSAEELEKELQNRIAAVQQSVYATGMLFA